jgi:hypothetical protein
LPPFRHTWDPTSRYPPPLLLTAPEVAADKTTVDGVRVLPPRSPGGRGHPFSFLKKNNIDYEGKLLLLLCLCTFMGKT